MKAGYILHGFGSNSSGMLLPGHGAKETANTKVIVSENEIMHVCGGNDFSVALSISGEVFIYGSESSVSRAVDEPENRTKLKVPIPEKAKQISAYYQHAIVITELGNVYTFGSAATCENKPRKVTFADSDVKIVQGDVGDTYSLLVADNGDVYGLGTLAGNNWENPVPTLLKGIPKIKQVACGASHALLVAVDGTVYGISLANANKELGNLPTGDYANPTKIPFPAGTVITYCAAGDNFSLFVTSQGFIYSCGNDDYKQTGFGETFGCLTKINIPAFVVTVSCSWNHAAALTSDSTVYTWGIQDDFRLGHERVTVQKVPSLSGMRIVKAIATGRQVYALEQLLVGWPFELTSILPHYTDCKITFK